MALEIRDEGDEIESHHICHCTTDHQQPLRGRLLLLYSESVSLSRDSASGYGRCRLGPTTYDNSRQWPGHVATSLRLRDEYCGYRGKYHTTTKHITS